MTDVYTFTTIRKFMEEHRECKNDSQAVDRIINLYFEQDLERDIAVNRLNKIIQMMEDKIKNLEHQLKEKSPAPPKENNKKGSE